MADFRISNEQYSDAYTALSKVLLNLARNPLNKAIIRVRDEDAANRMQAILDEVIDRVSIEFDGSEYGPNPLWTPSKLKKDKGRVILYGPYGQTLHTVGIDGAHREPLGRTGRFG